MTRGVLVRITQPTGRRLVLCCVLFMGGALREEAHQVQTPEGPVAQQQRDDEQQGQRSGAEQVHRWFWSALLDVNNGTLRFGQSDRLPTLSNRLYSSRVVS
jgi:hypothetical protein